MKVVGEMMEYGIWLSKARNDGKQNFHTMRECRHHGLQDHVMYPHCIDSSHVNPCNYWSCKVCQRSYRNGIRFSNVPGCSNYTGLYIAENVLSKAFSSMKKPDKREKYDFYCGNGFKIDSKCSVMHDAITKGIKYGQYFKFQISKNTVPDYFCLIGLDNTVDDILNGVNIKYVWLVPGTAMFSGVSLNSKISISVTVDNMNSMSRLELYRRTDMEGRIIKCCDSIKSEMIV
jgi:hypothetical protein